MDVSKLHIRASSTQERSLRIKGPTGNLESLLSQPQNDISSTVAVLCHPHPLHGGSMNNKVIFTLSKTLTELGIPCLRFNFRGVGNSEGVYADSIGEIEDLRTVIAFVQKYFPERKLWLAGFSFGSYVCLKTAQDTPLQQLITIAPAVHLFDFQNLESPECPWLLIQGEDDEIVDSKDVIDWAITRNPKPEIQLFGETSHFFHGKLGDLRLKIREYLLKTHPVLFESPQ